VAAASLRRWALAAGIAATLPLFLLPLSNPVPTLDGIETDKVAHAALIGGLALLVRWNLPAGRWRGAAAVLLAGVYAGLIELVQSALTFRTGDVTDLAAGLLGAAICVGAIGIAAGRRKAAGTDRR
jgi:VanZ family protein